MGLNKIQLKARLFEIIKPLRNAGAIDDITLSNTTEKITSIENADLAFISRLLIKEADCSDNAGATAFMLIAERISPETFVSSVMEELNSNTVSDSTKMFYINIMCGFGMKYAVEDIGAYLKNPAEALDIETSKFMKNAEIDPAAQIDFLDFFFASPEIDRGDLLDSVIARYKGDGLVNLIAPLVVASLDEKLIHFCLDVMEEEKSLYAVKPLKYLKYSKNKEIKERADKMLRKMSLSMVYTEEKLHNFYKEIMKDFNEPVFRISLPDGNSNFTMMISRQHKNGAWYALFMALNIKLGPFSCFGFPTITKADLDIITKRFYQDTTEIFIPLEQGKKIIEELSVKRARYFEIMPYEFYCWEKFFGDIISEKGRLEEVLIKNLRFSHINETEYKMILKMPFTNNWFYRYSKMYPLFCEMIDKIIALKEENLSGMEEIIAKYAVTKQIKSDIIIRLHYLAFCLKYTKYKPLAGLYFSLVLDEEKITDFIKLILKRSVYEHMLGLRLPVKSTNIFKKNERKARDVSAFIDYIEKNWTED
ncbi:MAG: hypothetical protein LUE64_02930 [Candidatus Gastranaerophilales bacterium]|nr:hypothetical protein [Candidatus Gastranaerophilales bacterium]